MVLGSVLKVSLEPPVFFVDHEDDSVLAFDSLDALVSYVEPWDAMRGDFRVFDSVGRRVGLRGEGVIFTKRSVGGGRTIAELSEPAVYEPEVLAAVLGDYIGAVGVERYGVTEEWVAGASLQELVGCIVQVGG